MHEPEIKVQHTKQEFRYFESRVLYLRHLLDFSYAFIYLTILGG